jgi:DNA-binding phage protein
VFTKPYDFSWTTLNEDQILERLKTFQQKTGESMNAENTIQMFMNNLLHPQRANSTFCGSYVLKNPADKLLNEILQESDETNLVQKLKHYIEHGNYIIVLRGNIVYMLKRSFASLIPAIGVMYGLLRTSDYGDRWFDAESQFKIFCNHYGLSTFDSLTTIENSSMYDYDSNIFFDGGSLRDRDDLLFFIMRH